MKRLRGEKLKLSWKKVGSFWTTVAQQKASFWAVVLGCSKDTRFESLMIAHAVD